MKQALVYSRVVRPYTKRIDESELGTSFGSYSMRFPLILIMMAKDARPFPTLHFPTFHLDGMVKFGCLPDVGEKSLNFPY